MSHTINTMAAPTTPASVQPEQSRMGVFTTVSALTLIWEKAHKHLTAQEMEWFADGAAEKVNGDIRALSTVLEETACIVASDEDSGYFQSAQSTSNLLFHLHNQLDAIAGMAEVSEQANWFARRALKGGKP